MGVISPFAPASMAPASGFLAGVRDRRDDRLEVPAPLQQLLVLPGSGFSSHDSSRVD